MRGSLERVAVPGAADERAPVAMMRHSLIRRLRELIVLLDRRVPRPERSSEMSIARDAAALRARALEQIAELERTAG